MSDVIEPAHEAAPVPGKPRGSGPIFLLLGLVAGAAAGFMVGFLARAESGSGADASAVAAPAVADGSSVVLRVGAETLTRKQFDARWHVLGVAGRAAYDRRGGKREFLEEIADELALAAEARARGLDHEPATAENARSAMNRAIARPLLAKEVRAAVLPESELRAFYEAHRAEMAKPLEVELSEIVITSSGGSGPLDDSPNPASARAKAERLHAALLAGDDFAATARRTSEAPTAPNGGLLGWLSPGGRPPAHETALLTLQPGQVSDILPVPEGFAILRASGRRESVEPPFDEVRDDILERLLRDDPEALQRRYHGYVTALRERLGCQVDPGGLE